MTTDPPPLPYVTPDEFLVVAEALMLAISRVARESCHSYDDRERMAANIASAIESFPQDAPNREAVKSILDALAAGVRSPTCALPRWNLH